MLRKLFTKNTRFIIIAVLILTVCMTAVSFYVLSNRKKNSDDELLCFRYRYDEDIIIYPFETEGKTYLFLPSGLDISDFVICSKGKVIMDDLSYPDGSQVITVETDRRYDIDVVEMDDVATMFMDVRIGDIEAVNADKTKKTKARVNVKILDESSDQILNEKADIKGRGSTSWLYHNKKSYNMFFYEDLGIMGMNKGRKWSLVSNPVDDIFNDDIFMDDNIVYGFARKLDFDFVPDCRYVNVYINGNYNGLYMITEKIGVEKNRLDLDHKNMYLLDTDINLKRDLLDNYFITEGNNVVEIDYPEVISDSLLKTISDDVQKLEDAIIDPESDAWKDMIDIDSWARVYLIDELFENTDGGTSSVYFYRNDQGLYVRGPLWDYDRIFAYGEDAIVVANEFRFSNQINCNYNYYLLQHDEFRQRVLEILKDEFIPVVENDFPSIVKESESVRYSSVIADQIRWNEDKDRSIYADRLIEYVDKRCDFLIDYYSNEDKYCKVQIENLSMQFENYTVLKGSTIADIEGLNESLLERDLYYKGTDTLFDMNDVIDQDISLVWSSDYDKYIPDLNIYESSGGLGIVNILSMLLFVSAFALFILVIRKER